MSPNVSELASWVELDETFDWRVVSRFEEPQYHGWVLELVSQTWLGSHFVDRPVWKHWMTILVPRKISASTAFLYIGGGSILDLAPCRPTERLVALGLHAGSVVVELWQVPNQPLRFALDPDELQTEDRYVAYLLAHYNGDVRTLPRYPMVKSAVAAMTATQQCLQQLAGLDHARKFVISGSSKRGWAAWLVALLDDRICGVAPVAINVLNVGQAVRHHWQSLGSFPDVLHPYAERQILSRRPHERWVALALRIEDPFSYVDAERMKIPKLIVAASGDEYFPADTTQYYFERLPGPKFLRILPNARHSPVGTDVNDTIAAWHAAIAHDFRWPDIVFLADDNGGLVLKGAPPAAVVKLWEATNPSARDFRVSSVGDDAFQARDIVSDGQGLFKAQVNEPPVGFTAYFLEVQFQLDTGGVLKLTSEMYVTPGKLPFAWTQAEEPPLGN